MRTLLVAPLLLSGCLSLPADPTQMSAEQLREWVKDRSTGIQCVIANTPWGRGIAVSVNVDQSKALESGSLSVDDACKIVLNKDSRPVQPVAPVAPVPPK